MNTLASRLGRLCASVAIAVSLVVIVADRKWYVDAGVAALVAASLLGLAIHIHAVIRDATGPRGEVAGARAERIKRRPRPRR
jgi:hypothetical protein